MEAFGFRATKEIAWLKISYREKVAPLNSSVQITFDKIERLIRTPNGVVCSAD